MCGILFVAGCSHDSGAAAAAAAARPTAQDFEATLRSRGPDSLCTLTVRLCSC